MGNQIFDQYTYLHFATGIILYFWNVNFLTTIILHTIFEIFQNSVLGIKFINKYIKLWPGGKQSKDALINSVGDTIGTILGWTTAYMIDKIGDKYGWYNSHISK
jgi:hypothetical protein